MFKQAFPILTTGDVGPLLGFYRDSLGGTVSFQFPADREPAYVGIDLGSSHLGIGHDADVTSGPDGQRFALWVYAEDCDAAVARLRTAGVAVVEEPTDQPWGERVARVRDPDGNLVIIGARAKG